MNFVVLDLELTQNPGSTPKIIQIGAAKMNSRNGCVQSVFSEICNPGELPDAFITELTGITAEAVRDAKPLIEVVEAFWAWFSSQQVGGLIYQWGRGDTDQLLRASLALGVAPHPKLQSFDLKQFAGPFRQAKNKSTRGGLKNTMSVFGLEFHGRQHDALNDAKAAGELFVFLNARILRIEAMERALLPNHGQARHPQARERPEDIGR
jgi:DNA polymerase III epsilon subunit-like protein